MLLLDEKRLVLGDTALHLTLFLGANTDRLDASSDVFVVVIEHAVALDLLVAEVHVFDVHSRVVCVGAEVRTVDFCRELIVEAIVTVLNYMRHRLFAPA